MNSDLTLALKEQCKRSIERFKARVFLSTPWTPRSILMSEGFAFCAVSDLLGVDVVLESGICNGRSTQMWANYFPSDTPIIAIERNNFKGVAVRRVKSYKNVKLARGDGPAVILSLVPKFSGKKIGIFLDGPKDVPAINFAKKVLPLPNVVLVGIHDMSVTKGRFDRDQPELNRRKGELYHPPGRIEFDKWELGQFLTDEKWFVEEYSWLDKNESGFDAKQKMYWTPYVYVGTGGVHRELNSYGPTVGFCFEWESSNVS